ncbi:hypothetical protein BGX34_008119, partial [Mortierella sp. NVP85]
MVDRDPAMDSACFSILPQTRIINCMWHGGQNPINMLQPQLTDGWNTFIREFNVASRSPLPAEFDERWRALYETFGNGNQVVTKYLDGLYKDRFQWAWPWGWTTFTASMQSTQRVEKVNHLIKYMGPQSTSSHATVLKVTSAKVDLEFFKDKIATKGGRAKQLQQFNPTISGRMFKEIIWANNRVLGSYACSKMRSETEFPLTLEALEARLDEILEVYGTCGERSDTSDEQPAVNLRWMPLAALLERLNQEKIAQVYQVKDKLDTSQERWSKENIRDAPDFKPQVDK